MSIRTHGRCEGRSMDTTSEIDRFFVWNSRRFYAPLCSSPDDLSTCIPSRSERRTIRPNVREKILESMRRQKILVRDSERPTRRLQRLGVNGNSGVKRGDPRERKRRGDGCGMGPDDLKADPENAKKKNVRELCVSLYSVEPVR